MAPMREPSTKTSPTFPASGEISTIPSPIVFATSWPRSAPTKFMTAAISSARLGVRARVATAVAIALAASWKPLVKSKIRATTTMTETKARVPSMRQDSFMAIDSTVDERSSKASKAPSRASRTALILSTSRASVPPLKSSAIIDR